MRFAFTLLFLLGALATGHAASTPWLAVDGGKIRLIGMPSVDGGPYRAGLQIELEPGWKTYWRNPGGSGLPPQLDFSASKNVETTEVSYPAPKYYPEDSSIGYKKSVTFPISVKPVLKGLPFTVAVRGLVGICSDVCIPTPFDLSMPVGAVQGSEMEVAFELNRWKAKVPTMPQQGFSVERIDLDGNNKRSATITARIPEDATDLALFVEGPINWYLIRALLIDRTKTSARFSLDLSEVKEGEQLVGRPLRLTLVTSQGSVDQTLPISAATGTD